MFIRKTKRKNRDGTVVEYLQLAHNVRHPETRKPTAQILYNFGRADTIDREAMMRLCYSIARACGVQLNVGEATTSDQSPNARHSEQTWPDNLNFLESRPLGPVLVTEALWERLGIGQLLRDISAREKYQVPYERALFAMTANRLCEPCSKLGTWDRWLPRVHLPTCRALKLDNLYESMDLLHKHAAEVEETIFFNTANLFNLEVDVVFYDTTTASFSIDFEDIDVSIAQSEGNASEEPLTITGLRKRGRSKDGTWSPQVVVALAVTREGFPVRSWVFPGNTTDVTTVEAVKKDLQGWRLNRCLFVADAGMNSEENRKLLTQGGGSYLLAARAESVKEIREDVLTRGGRYKKVADNLLVKAVEIGAGVLRKRYFVCFNPKEAERQKLHRKTVLQELKQELARHQKMDATSRWAVSLLASSRTKKYLGVSEDGKIFIDRAKVMAAQKFDGKWVLITNDDTLQPEDAATGYKNLLIIERCFRTMKSTQIHMTPMYHWLPHRIEAHVKICVLALLIQRVAEFTTAKTWGWLHHALSQLQAAEFETPSHRFFRRNEPSKEVYEILSNLNISMPRQVLEIKKRLQEP
jgi:transposase